MIKQSFYTGYNEEFVSKLRYGKREKLRLIRISSEIKDNSHLYELWFDFILTNGQQISSEKVNIDCTTIFNERGYVQKDLVNDQFKKILEEQLTKKLN
jgi:hypothetical protein